MKNLYVGNLPHSTTEAELRNIFGAYGAIDKITLVTDRDTGRSRGFGFVEMSNASEADKAIAALNGTDLGGRTLTINEAKPKSERPRVGGHRFGGGGGRGQDDYRGHPRQPREPLVVFSNTICPATFEEVPVGYEQRIGIRMPRGPSTFTKRQKEHTRQQRQKDKAERRNQRRQEKVLEGSVDEMADLRKHAPQAALFNTGVEELKVWMKPRPMAASASDAIRVRTKRRLIRGAYRSN